MIMARMDENQACLLKNSYMKCYNSNKSLLNELRIPFTTKQNPFIQLHLFKIKPFHLPPDQLVHQDGYFFPVEWKPERPFSLMGKLHRQHGDRGGRPYWIRKQTCDWSVQGGQMKAGRWESQSAGQQEFGRKGGKERKSSSSRHTHFQRSETVCRSSVTQEEPWLE